MKHVYFFGKGQAEGGRDDRELLGGKGADLAEMARLGVNVPPGFTVSTLACEEFLERGELSPGLTDEIREHLARLEAAHGRRFGDGDAPLLVSVRSGAAVSMPGMMDTVLNLGATASVVESLAAESGDRRFALDTYRRLIQMFTNVVKGLKLEAFEEILEEAVAAAGVDSDAQLPAAHLEGVVERFLEIYEQEVGDPFPDDPMEQLIASVAAVFASWNTPRAIKYRDLHGIPHDMGTAANVQAMVFGNLNDRSGSGVAFTRNPATGEKRLYGEWLLQAQGEDVVAGVRTPRAVSIHQRDADGDPSLEEVMPDCYRELERTASRLEEHFGDMLDLEFTIQDNTLYMLQSRSGKRTGAAAVQIAVDMEAEALVDRATALGRVDPTTLEQLLHPHLDAGPSDELIAEGAPASPGAAVGSVVFTAEEAEQSAANGEQVILVRPMTVADDVGGMAAASGVLTARGGMTSHAAVVARGMGKPCVTGASALEIDVDAGSFSTNGRSFTRGDLISLDGTTGRVYAGAVRTVEPELSNAVSTLMGWADESRTLGVRANADTGADAARARSWGAEGVGLCRTEHMFFAEERLHWVQVMILAEDEEHRAEALGELEAVQRADFLEIFEAMDGLPVTVRLLDPPLHEFLPDEPHEVEELAERLGVDAHSLEIHIDGMRGENPMLGHRGCRLGITTPAIYRMQVRAILSAAREARRQGRDAQPEIMVPLIASAGELKWIKAHVIEPIAHELGGAESLPHFGVGAMIETPRACLDAAAIARESNFFSIGTNDLTQMTYGFSRDDSEQFLTAYRREMVMAADPFEHFDAAGTGRLVELAVERGRAENPDLIVGICGEHGGDPESIQFFHRAGLDYVSCSPFRIPVARLSAAQAANDAPVRSEAIA